MHLGQLPQNIALRLKQTGVNVLGTDPEKIDTAEDRHKFSSVLDSIGIDQPEWAEVTTLDAAKEFANKVGSVNTWLPHHDCQTLNTVHKKLDTPFSSVPHMCFQAPL
jgi:carbamoylphosphate synthase large subunit